MRVHHRDPLLAQVFNPAPAFFQHLSTLSQTPIPIVRDKILEDLSLQEFRHIRTTIGSHSPTLLPVSMISASLPSLDCDVVLAAHAADQAQLLAWR